MELIRLSKLMSERGICSRREADGFISRGLVWVDGQRISELGTRVAKTSRIKLDPIAHSQQQEKITIILNKPIGYVSNLPEKGYVPAIDLITINNQDLRTKASSRPFHQHQLAGLAVAGRLDIDSQGLLVFTQDGRLAKRLIGPNSTVEKEYLVRIEGVISPDKLMRLRHGLSLDGRPLRQAKVEQINESQLRMVLQEGRKRQIRRMCELVQLRVTGLKRVRIGKLRLESLKEGQWRYLGESEPI